MRIHPLLNFVPLLGIYIVLPVTTTEFDSALSYMMSLAYTRYGECGG